MIILEMIICVTAFSLKNYQIRRVNPEAVNVLLLFCVINYVYVQIKLPIMKMMFCDDSHMQPRNFVA